MIDLFYQVFPGMYGLPDKVWQLFWWSVFLTPFAMLGVYFLSRWLTRFISGGAWQRLKDCIHGLTLADDKERIKYLDNLSNARRIKRNAKSTR